MNRSTIHSPFWNSTSAMDTRLRIRACQRDKLHRPTVVVPITDYVGRPLVVRHATTGVWGLIQGEIEEEDGHPLDAALREASEEGSVPRSAIEGSFPYVGEQGLSFSGPPSFPTGYSKGSLYVMVGLRLRPGADVSIEPAPGHEKALLERIWCANVDQAVRILQEQPGVANVTPHTLEKTDKVLIPALESIYLPETVRLLERLDYMG